MLLSTGLGLLLLSWALRKALGQECFSGTRQWVAEAGVRGKALGGLVVFDVDSLHECLRLCKTMPNCQSVNLLTKPPPSTSLSCEMSESPSLSSQPDPSALFHAQALCVDEPPADCNASLAFHKTPGLAMTQQRFTLIAFVEKGLSECLSECWAARWRGDACRSVGFDAANSLCRLHTVDRHSVRKLRNFFAADPQWDLYEANCPVALGSRDCHYLRAVGEGMETSHSAAMWSVESAEACASLCLAWSSDVCRSWTYRSRDGRCLLGHAAHRTLSDAQRLREPDEGRRTPLLTVDNDLEMADLDDCPRFQLSCGTEGMNVEVDSLRLLSGALRSKAQPDCATKVQDQFSFTAQIPYLGCGTVAEEEDRYSNVLFYKDASSHFITVRDKLLQLVCRIVSLKDLNDIKLTYSMDILPQDPKRKSGVAVPDLVADSERRVAQPRFSLRVLDSEERPVEEVGIGEIGFLEIALLDPSVQGIPSNRVELSVTSVVAASVEGGEEVRLYDAWGCPADASVAGPLRRLADGRVLAPVNFTGFPDGARIFYKGLVQPCPKPCHKVCSSTKRSGTEASVEGNSLRRLFRRSIGQTSHLVLAEEKFATASRQLLLHRPKSSEGIAVVGEATVERVVRLPRLLQLLDSADVPDYMEEESGRASREPNETGVEVGPVPSPLSHCFLHSLPCLMTVILAGLQAVLATMCVCLVLLHCRRSSAQRGLSGASSASTLSSVASDLPHQPLSSPPPYEIVLKNQGKNEQSGT